MIFHLCVCVCVYLQLSVLFSSDKYMEGSAIAGSYGSSILNFLRNFHTVFQSLYQFTFPPIMYGVPFFYILANTCFISPFLRILTRVRWYLTVILICISLITSYEHFFMNLLAICMSLRKKHLFSSSVQFLTRLFGVF